jgi:hypothetical protein
MVNNSTNINKMKTTSPHLKSLSTKNPRHMSIEITVLSLYSHKIWSVIDIGLVNFWMFNSEPGGALVPILTDVVSSNPDQGEV